MRELRCSFRPFNPRTSFGVVEGALESGWDDGELGYAQSGGVPLGKKKNARAMRNTTIIMGLGAMGILVISRLLKCGIADSNKEDLSQA